MASGKGRLWVTAIIAVAVVVIAAVIVLYPHEIDVTSEGDGKVIPAGGTEMRFTETLRLEIVPGEDTVTYVYVDGELKAQDVTSYEFRVSALDFDKHTIKVVFQKVTPPEPEKEFTLSVISEGEGTVTPSGETKYAGGTVVTLKATPGSGNVVGDVIIDGVSAGPGGSVQVRMDSDHDVKVVFRPVAAGDVPVTISVDVDLDIVVETLGAVFDYGEVVPSGTVYVAPHGSLTITVILNPGFKMKDMTVDDISYGAVTEHTITDITKSVSVEISIVKKVQGFVIKASAGTGGSISPSGDVKVEKGKDVTFTFTPASGYKVSTLTVDGKTIALTSNSYTFTDVQSAHTIAVTFQATGGSGGGSSGGGGTVKTLTGITTSGTYRTTYYDGDSFDRTGLTVTAHYSDGTSETVTDYTVSPSTLSTSDTTVTIRYQDKTTTIDITVNPVIQSIEVTTPPLLVYRAGQYFDPSGMVVTATYSNSGTADVTESCTYNGLSYSNSNTILFEDITESGHPFRITVSYTEGTVSKSTNLNISVGQGEGFDVKVTRHYGSKMNGSSVESFDIHYQNPVSLQNFTFDTSKIVPGIEQTIEVRITNTSGHDLDSFVYITGISGDQLLKEQIFISTNTVNAKPISDIAEGEFVSLETIGSSNTIEITITISFPHSPDNNKVMGMGIGFSIGIFASISGGSP